MIIFRVLVVIFDSSVLKNRPTAVKFNINVGTMDCTPERQSNNEQEVQTRNELSNSARKSIVLTLVPLFENGTFGRGVLTEVGQTFGVHRSTVKRIWDQNAHLADDAVNISAANFSKRANRGRTRVYNVSNDLVEEIRQIPVSERRTLRDLSGALQIPLASVHKLVSEGALRRHTSAVKPTLTEANKLLRVAWCHEHEDHVTGRYSEMLDIIHVDEKWFNLTELNKQCYLADGEEDPYRSTCHKSHVPRVMFLAAVARPRYVHGQLWDGKIGIWECVDYVPAARASRNRPRGTIEPKPYNINGDRYLSLVVDKILPAIAERCPQQMKRNNRIIIQHDNAPPHQRVTSETVEFVAKCQELGLDVKIREQPPNSPDLNILDLGIFRALQSKQFRKSPTNLMQLIQQTKETYEEYEASKLDDAWYTLQCVMNEIVDADGGNDFKIPHVGKRKLERMNALNRSIVPRSLHAVFDDEGEMNMLLNDNSDDDEADNNDDGAVNEENNDDGVEI